MNQPQQHIRLLLLEDNPRDAELTERFLRREKLDFSLTVVDNEGAFRAQLKSSDPDLILSDYSMPGFDGMLALRIARVLAPETPFIFLSGSIGEERAVEALREGATDYVLKDRIPRLASAIVRALAERRERALRRSVEQALLASEQRFQYAAAATREIIMDWNLFTSRIWFGDALRNYWGYESAHSEMRAEWFRERIHPEDRDAVARSIEEAISGTDRWRAEFRFARADDSYSNVVTRGIVVRDGHGTAVRLIGAIFDVTEQIQLRQQLEQARRVESLGRVAATVAHEFNNVLMCIGSVPDLLQRNAREPVIERAAVMIGESVTRGRRLTEQILRFGRPAEPVFRELDLAEWLEQRMPELRELAGVWRTVLFESNGLPLPVTIDSAQMQQVLCNLVANARDATANGGIIRIRTHSERQFASLSVIDRGAGIPPNIVEQIFEPLFTTKRSGTGLGLAVAQQIVVQHRGTMGVTSAVGEGTTFQILLPLAI